MARKLRLWRWTRKDKKDVLSEVGLADIQKWLVQRKYTVDPQLEADLAREASEVTLSKAQPELPFQKKGKTR